MTTYAYGGKTYLLESTITSSQTTINLRSFTEPVTGENVTMALMNSTIVYGTLDPKTDRSEFISFTGITQNDDGSATLTGVTRGLKRGYDFTSSDDFKLSHQSGSKFILSDSPEALNAMLASNVNITIGSTPIASGTTTKVLYDNAGVLGEYTVSGSGNVAMTTSPVLTTPVISSIVNTGTLTLPTATTTLVGTNTTDTLTNKRVTPRTGTTTSSATPTINTDNVDFYSITAQSGNITSMTTNLSGTPTEGQTLWLAMTATSGTPTITWGASFEPSSLPLPTGLTTDTQDFRFRWNSTTSKWRFIGFA